MQEFYVENLEFNRVDVEAHVELNYEDYLDKALDVNADESGDEEEEWEDSEEEEDAFLSDPRQKAMLAMQERKMMEEISIEIDWNGLWEDIIKQCPKIPQPPVVEQINPPPYPMQRVLFGKLMPKPDDEKKGKKGKAAAKKPEPKKKGEAPKPVKWASEPPPKFMSTAHYLDAAKKELY